MFQQIMSRLRFNHHHFHFLVFSSFQTIALNCITKSITRPVWETNNDFQRTQP